MPNNASRTASRLSARSLPALAKAFSKSAGSRTSRDWTVSLSLGAVSFRRCNVVVQSGLSGFHNSDSRGKGDRLFQQLEVLQLQVLGQDRDPSHIPGRPRQGRGKAHFDRVAADTYDGDLSWRAWRRERPVYST